MTAPTVDPSLVLYRFYGDDGALLYIGKTIAVRERLSQHKTTAAFFELVRNVTLTRGFTSDAELCRAETAAIRAERPRFNVADNPAKRPKPVDPWRRAYQLLDAMGRALRDRRHADFDALSAERHQIVDAMIGRALAGDTEARDDAARMILMEQEHLLVWGAGLVFGWDWLSEWVMRDYNAGVHRPWQAKLVELVDLLEAEHRRRLAERHAAAPGEVPGTTTPNGSGLLPTATGLSAEIPTRTTP